MKKKKFQIDTLILLCGFGLLTACSSGEGFRFQTDRETGFTEFTIDHPFGKNLSFQAGAQSGAVGYILAGDTVWLAGKPKRAESESQAVVYRWADAEPVAQLTVQRKGEDRILHFSIENDKLQPSAWLLNVAAGEEAYFTGVFERVVDGSQRESWKEGITTGLNLRGERVEVKLKPTVSAYAPFYISSENYGFFVHGTWPGVIDFCKEESKRVGILFEGPSLMFTLYLDRNPAELVKRHALETGPSFVPPRWALGPWRWRDEHKHYERYFDGSPVTAPYNSDLVEDVLMMQAYDIPCTAYWIDRPWGPGERGFDDYRVDEKRFPSFEPMLQWMNRKDMELMLWIGPFVMGEMARTALENNYHMVSKNHISRNQVLMDFTNPEASRWWGENGPGKLARMGVKGFKLDRADGEKLVDSLHLITHSGISYRENYNDFPVQYVKATYDAVHEVLGDDMILFPRAQYTGSSRYGALWAGDTGNPPEGLRSALIALLRCSVMGYPVWGSDTGGYPKRIDREVTLRWLGFSCFSPLMEVGPTNNRGFWGMNYDPEFDHELLAAWRFYAQLRMYLIDYVHGLAQEARETGMPVARPLFLVYPEAKESWTDWTTYLLGNDLLVSVVWEKGVSQKAVWLPSGETWMDLWTGVEYSGGQTVNVQAEAYQTPVFLRKGSSLGLPDFSELYRESLEKTALRYSMETLEKMEQW
ncbi:MAG TPA: glycoside hydrolase family 31 protein [Prolixibacteraceae bacterium]|nr:glycoside hydrolase family 31 protein [Prolixibacteraceae bacterium]